MRPRRNDDVETIRQPPWDEAAEQSVLGGLMLDEKALAQIADWLDVDDFYTTRHRLLYSTIRELAAKETPHDAVTIGDHIARTGLELEGGLSYVIEITNATPSAANVVAYAGIVKEKARLRALINVGTETATAAFGVTRGGSSAEMIAADASRKLAQIVTRSERGGPVSIRQGVKAFYADLFEKYERNEPIVGLPSPWPNLNKITQGFLDGELTIIGARPNMGKTIVGLNIVDHLGINMREHGALFSLEMVNLQVTRRMVSARSGIAFSWLRAPTKGGEEELTVWPEVQRAVNVIAEATFVVDDQAAITAEQICLRAEREHLKRPLRWVVIDHLHEVSIPGENETAELGRATKRFKQLAKDLACPVFLLAQLKRTGDKRPTMSDLRQAGGIEEAADNILLLHREEYHNPGTHLKRVVELYVGKGRDIQAGAVAYLENDSTYMRFKNWEGPLPKPPKDDKPSRYAPGGGRSIEDIDA